MFAKPRPWFIGIRVIRVQGFGSSEKALLLRSGTQAHGEKG